MNTPVEEIFTCILAKGNDGNPPTVTVGVHQTGHPYVLTSANGYSEDLGRAAQILEAALWAFVHGGVIGLEAEFEAHPSIWTH